MAKVHFRYFPSVVGLMLVLGLYFPTEPSPHLSPLFVAANLTALLLLLVLGLQKDGLAPFGVSIALLAIVPLLAFFTYVTGMPTLHLGAFLSYGLLSLLLLINVRSISAQPWLEPLWLVVNLINLAGGVAILLGSQAVDNFIITHYSMGYDDLVPNMLMWHKPVLTFATHSIASFFLFVFFWINLQTHAVRRRIIYLLVACSYLPLLFALLSVSAFAFGCLGILVLCVHLWRIWPRATLLGGAFMLMVSAIAIWSYRTQLLELWDVVTEVITAPGSGFLGRYTAGGTMYGDIQYLSSHPFRPVGASFNENLMAGDSGPVEYLLRGSVPLVLLVYGGFWAFLRRNLISRNQAVFFFAITLAFETGISVLTYFRTLYILPFLAVYLNSLEQARSGREA